MTAANDDPRTQLRAIQARIDQLRREIRAKKFAVRILCELYDEIDQKLATNTQIERQLSKLDTWSTSQCSAARYPCNAHTKPRPSSGDGRLRRPLCGNPSQ